MVHGQSTYRNLRRKRFLKKNAALDTSKPKNLTGDHRSEQKQAKPEEKKAEDNKPEENK